jgi:hypothetical protein
MSWNKRTARIAAMAAAMLVMAACNFPTDGTPGPTPTEHAADGTSTASPSAEVSPTPEPTPEVCVPEATFVADVTIPDGTSFPQSASFVKVWRVRNSGGCAWDAGTVLAFVSGDQMNGPGSVDAGAVPAGAEADLSVELQAPASSGSYEGRWRLRSPGDGGFGPTLPVSIVVQQPTATPTPSCVPPEGGLESILSIAEDAGQNPGCPIGPAVTVDGALQRFETNPENPNPHARIRGYMIWRGDEDLIYALGDGWECSMPSHDGEVLHVYQGEWEEGMPYVHPDCASMSVPEGYEMPIRGFGRAWCENSLWESSEVGWAADPESGVRLLIQPTRNGALIRVLGHPWGVTWDFALDIPAGRWFSTSVGP